MSDVGTLGDSKNQPISLDLLGSSNRYEDALKMIGTGRQFRRASYVKETKNK